MAPSSHSKLQRGLHRYRHIKSTAALQRQSNPGLLDPYVPSFSTCVSVQSPASFRWQGLQRWFSFSNFPYSGLPAVTCSSSNRHKWELMVCSGAHPQQVQWRISYIPICPTNMYLSNMIKQLSSTRLPLINWRFEQQMGVASVLSAIKAVY